MRWLFAVVASLPLAACLPEPDAAPETWVVRVGVSLLVAPPPTDLRTFLSAVMEPVLQPEKDA